MSYDLIIVGAGPAGLSASVYASRYGVKNVVVGEIEGGVASTTHEIGNWLGEKSISGFEFSQKATDHVKSLEAEIKNASVDQFEKKDKGFELMLSNGEKISGKTLLLALGTKHRKLGVLGEKEFFGKGVSYCATCDGFFYKDKIAAVVGGGDSAASASIHLSGIAKKVYLISREEKLGAESFWVKGIEEKNNVDVIYNANIKEIKGENKVESIELDTIVDGKNELEVDGVFVEIGSFPNTEILKNLELDLEEDGLIRIDEGGRTSVNGVWAAGDVTTGSNKFRQIITAASEGAIAANGIYKYLSRQG
jgi:thioredoxin reductase (NADPH)